MREFTVVVNECAAVSGANPIPVRTRATRNAKRNFLFNIEDVARGLPAPLGVRQLDWIETLVALYATDLVCERGEETDWGRDIDLHVPVRDPDLWNEHAVAFSQIFMDLTSDRLRLTFHLDENPAEPPRLHDQFAEFDCVALLSGGVDSFAGALTLVDDGRRPLFLRKRQGSSGRFDGVVPFAVEGAWVQVDGGEGGV